MSEHRIVVPTSQDPKPVTARCACGGWERPFRSVPQRLVVLDEARQHVGEKAGADAVWMLRLNDGGTVLQDHSPED